MIPVGRAWQRVKQTDPAFDLFMLSDDEFPNIDGTYLTAAVIYATILGRNPADVAYVPTDVLPDTGPASFFRDKWKEADEHAPFLQQMAWETVQEYRSR